MTEPRQDQSTSISVMLIVADADAAVVIADDHDSAESKVATALDDFGDASNMDDALVQPWTLFFSISLTRTICHVTSILEIGG